MSDHDEFDSSTDSAEGQATTQTADAQSKGGDIKQLRARAEKASALEKENALLKLGVDTGQPQVQLFLEAKRGFDFSDLDAVKAEMQKYGILTADGDTEAGAGQSHPDQAAYERVSQAGASGTPTGTVNDEPDWGSMQTVDEVIAAVQARGGQVIYESGMGV